MHVVPPGEQAVALICARLVNMGIVIEWRNYMIVQHTFLVSRLLTRTPRSVRGLASTSASTRVADLHFLGLVGVLAERHVSRGDAADDVSVRSKKNISLF